MKRIQLVVLSICSMINANAQPVLNSAEMLPIGSIMQEKYIQNLYVIDTTLQGPNMTWDFSAIQNDTIPDYFISVVDPLNTPYGASFPSANYAYVEGPNSYYSYYNLSSAKMERIGSYSTDISIYDDPQTELIYPLSVGVSNLDTWFSSGSAFGGNYNLECIGSGTLMTPGGTFQDALLVRVNFDETFYALKIYFWYSSENGSVLLELVKGDGVFVADQAFYLASLDTKIKENDLVTELKYNNPVIDVLQLAYHSKNNQLLNYTVRNSLGQIISSGQLPAFSNYSEIDFSKLSKGIYFVNISSEKSQDGYSLKLVKM